MLSTYVMTRDLQSPSCRFAFNTLDSRQTRLQLPIENTTLTEKQFRHVRRLCTPRSRKDRRQSMARQRATQAAEQTQAKPSPATPTHEDVTTLAYSLW